jgi:hypothetical protein
MATDHLDITIPKQPIRGRGLARGFQPCETIYAPKIRGQISLAGHAVISNPIHTNPVRGSAKLTGTFVRQYLELNTVIWAGIGSMNCIPSKSNITAGHAVLPWRGPAWDVRKLGQNLIVYGQRGISKLHPVSDPFPGYGQNVLVTQGIDSRYAVCGDELIHYYVAEDGNLYSLRPNALPEKLGYSEFFAPFMGNFVSLYEPSSGRAFFSSEEVGKTLVYNPELGLTVLDIVITDLYVANDGTLQIVSPSINNNELPIILHECVSHATDFGQRCIKTLTGLAFGIDFEATTQAWAIVYYRFDKTQSFTKFKEVRLNKECYAHIGASGLEFMVGLKFQRSLTLEPIYLDYIHAQVQFSDKRYRRGLIASAGRGGPDVDS